MVISRSPFSLNTAKPADVVPPGDVTFCRNSDRESSDYFARLAAPMKVSITRLREVFFSRPETKPNNHYWAGIVRYSKNKDYESIAIGRKSEHLYFRRDENWVFDIDLNILIGFCKWTGVDDQNVKLYQVLDFELSSIQSIQYNPINSKGVFFRAGIVENFLYVIEKKPKFLVGAMLAFGMKF